MGSICHKCHTCEFYRKPFLLSGRCRCFSPSFETWYHNIPHLKQKALSIIQWSTLITWHGKSMNSITTNQLIDYWKSVTNQWLSFWWCIIDWFSIFNANRLISIKTRKLCSVILLIANKKGELLTGAVIVVFVSCLARCSKPSKIFSTCDYRSVIDWPNANQYLLTIILSIDQFDFWWSTVIDSWRCVIRGDS